MGFIFLFLAIIIGISTSSVFAATDDLDRDGVADEIDSCPNLQEDYVGIIDGCPEQ